MSFTDYLPVVGNIIDGIVGNYQRRKAPELAGKTAYNENMQGVLGRVEAAKSLGLHPTAVLGGSFGGSGAPMPVGTDFGGAFAQSNANTARDKQYRVENAQREAEESRRRLEFEDSRLLNEANRRRLESESNLLDQQLLNAQDELARRQSQHTKTSIAFPGDGIRGTSQTGLPNAPHIAKGGPSPLWEKVVYPDGTTEMRPAGAQAEQSEYMNTVQDISAHYQIDPRWLTGKKTFDFYRKMYDHATGRAKPPKWFQKLRPHRITHNP